MNENYYANLSADTIGSNHEEIKINENNMFAYLYDNIEMYDDLGSTDPGILSLSYASKIIKKAE